NLLSDYSVLKPSEKQQRVFGKDAVAAVFRRLWYAFFQFVFPQVGRGCCPAAQLQNERLLRYLSIFAFR
ncbi:hypothetical protein, partial [Bergeriella denitrificans]|uniref:hypothetical protein n=1 Tax=Bergeriella denitrificans TaxID=494 RepID=UPI001C3F7A49